MGSNGQRQSMPRDSPETAFPEHAGFRSTGESRQQSTGTILWYLLGEAQDPAWSPLASARRIIAHAEADLPLLQGARTQLMQTDAARPQPPSHTRALVTLHIAIADLCESLQETDEAGTGDARRTGERGRG